MVNRTIAASALQSILNGAFSGLVGCWFRGAGRGAWDFSPVIKDLRNMFYPIGSLGKPQDQVVILTSVQLQPKTSDLLENGFPQDQEMRHVVQREQQIGVPVWLKERLDPSAVDLQFILVGVQEIGGLISVKFSDHFEQGVGTEFVVIIQETDEFPGSERQTLIGRSCDALVLREMHYLDPGI